MAEKLYLSWLGLPSFVLSYVVVEETLAHQWTGLLKNFAPDVPTIGDYVNPIGSIIGAVFAAALLAYSDY
jgi:hypothetical protein